MEALRRRLKERSEAAPTMRQGAMQSLVVEGKYHYIRNGDGTEEVYDIFGDPSEHSDLIATPTGRAVADRWRPTLPDLSKTDPARPEHCRWWNVCS